ncbi:MAG: carbohydrate kinase family protein [Anaerolineaceae bacterium]|nr:carbohydrate kinase family protein [Anaerolineaceae bacterium]
MTKHRLDLFCVGGTSVDLVLRVPRLLKPGEKLPVEFEGRVPGGMIANAACAAGRLGLRTGWSGRVGDDDAGGEFLAAFADYGVDASTAQVLPDSITDLCVVLVEPSGERSLMIVPTITALPQFLPVVRRFLASCQFGYTIPYELSWFREFADLVHAGGGQVVVDVESSIPLQGPDLLEALKLVDIAFCSEDGARFASGKQNIDAAAQTLLDLGLSLVVVTMGSRGAAAYQAQQSCKVPGFRVPVVDTTGAGDCFHAAFLMGWLKNWSLERCLVTASAAAAIAVGHEGPRGGLPTAQEVAAFLAAQDDLDRID